MTRKSVESLYECEVAIEDVIRFLEGYQKYSITKSIQNRLLAVIRGETNSLEDLMFLVEADGLTEFVNNPDMEDYLLAQKYGYQLQKGLKMSTLEDFSEDEIAEFIEYLDDLRESGETNLLAAAPYLRDQFGLTKQESKDVLFHWMENFGKERQTK